MFHLTVSICSTALSQYVPLYGLNIFHWKVLIWSNGRFQYGLLDGLNLFHWTVSVFFAVLSLESLIWSTGRSQYVPLDGLNICMFYLILYVPSAIFQLNRDRSSWVEPVLSKDKWVLLKDHNAVTSVRLKPAASRSPFKHSTTEPLRSHGLNMIHWPVSIYSKGQF